MRTSFIFFISMLLIAFQSDSTRSSEQIRKKIEDASTNGINAFGEQIHCMNEITKFYMNREFQTAWNSKTAKQIISEIGKAGSEGLDPSDYHFKTLLRVSSTNSDLPLAKAEYDLLLTDAFLLYTSHLLSGKVNPQTIDSEWHVSRREGDPAELLNRAIASNDISTSVKDALPKHVVYKSLKAALNNYQSKAKISWELIPHGEVLKQGMNDLRIPAIHERLFILGDLEELSTIQLKNYDQTLLNSVKRFQQRHGLASEGNIGEQTINALNISVKQRINQIKANMERWRWLPQEFGSYYIIVNIANYELDVIKNGQKIRTHKVITGKPYRKTPVFSSKMQYLVFNPAWTIPPGIIKADVVPGIRKDLNYLKKKNIEVFDNKGNLLDISTVDWQNNKIYSFTYRQPSGPENALGAVKFMFPNSFHVYLHDTPSKELFTNVERALSSGCIRVHEPLSLAEYLLNDQNLWNKERIDKIIASNVTQTVHLKDQPNIHLLYWTAWTDTDNIIHFRNDIYKRDAPLIEQLDEHRHASMNN